MLADILPLLKKAAIRQKWVLFTAFSILFCFWLLLQHSVRQGVSRSLMEQETSSAVLLHALEDSVVRSFQAVNSSMLTLAESLPQREQGLDIENTLREQLRTSPQIRSIDLIKVDGLVVASVTRSEGVRLNYNCINTLRRETMTEFVIEAPRPGRYPNDPFEARSAHQHIPFCIPVRDTQGQTTHVLIASVNPQYFNDLFTTVSGSYPSHVHLYRYDGTLLVSTGGIEPRTDVLQAKLGDISWGQYRETLDQTRALVSFRSTSLLPLVTVLVSEEHAALASWRHDEQMIKLFLLVVTLVVLLSAFFIAVLLEKKRQAQGDIHLLSTAMRSTANAIFITNQVGDIHWINKAFTHLTGYGFDEVQGKKPSLLNSGCHSDAFFKQLWQMILSGESWRGELINRHKSGRTMVVEQTITPIFDEQGVVDHFIAVHEDVTARKSAEQRALFLADHDPLTDLPNRRFFEKRLQTLFTNQETSGLAILFIDLDRFKEINDTMGHEAGDSLLVHTTLNLNNLLKDKLLLARLGGDEFAILVEQEEGDDQLVLLAESVISTVARPFHYGEGVFSVTCSVGIAVSESELSDASMMLRQADMAMYRAKHAGKNTFRFFDEAMDALMKRRVFLQQQLERAVQSDHALSLRFQPQVDAHTGRVYGAEALLRWEVDQGEWISPAEFITLAEETGQILEVGIWLMERLFSQIADWNQRGISFGKISMNISAVQLARDSLAERLLMLLERFSISPDQICVEITETTLMANSERVKDNLKRLKQAGITLSIDDFGTGYSSLSYLKAVDADHLKIDRSFIIGIGQTGSDEHIVQATIALAHSLHLETVAEGVDSPEQLEFLQRLGCNYIQGYLFAKPLMASDFEHFIAERLPVTLTTLEEKV